MKASMATVSCLLLLLLLLPIALRSEAEFSPRHAFSGDMGEMGALEGAGSAFPNGSPYHPAECCFTYVTRAIPRWRILGYYESSSQCVNPGIVFITKKGHVICANPRDDWVQDYIQELEKI